MDTYLQAESAYRTIAADSPAGARFTAYDAKKTYLKDVSANNRPANTMVVNYYALISMAVMFGSFFGRKEAEDIQADLSARGARMNLIPVPKMRSFGFSICAALLIQLLSLIVLVAFLALVLRVDFGAQLWPVLLLCLVGSTTGISLGLLVCTLVKGEKSLARASSSACSCRRLRVCSGRN